MKPSDPDPPPAESTPAEVATDELLSALWSATQAIKRHVAPMLEREHGLEFKDFIALSAIESGSNYPGLVCGRLAMTPSAVSRLIDELVKGGHVVRRLDEQDSRRVQLSLTPAGGKVLAATRQTMHAAVQRGLSGLPEAQLLASAQLLRRLGATFSPAPAGPGTPAAPDLTPPPAPPETPQP